MNEDHNMTLREKFQEHVEQQVWQGEDEYTKNMPVGNVADWFIAQFDEMLAEDIGKIVYGVRPRMEAYEIEIIATKVLEDRRLSLKK